MRPTQSEAIAYVARKESEWNLPASREYRVEPHPPMPAVGLDVFTDSNHWTVWIESGMIYGEC